MNPTNVTGLGEPEPVGKKSLFQPPETASQPKTEQRQAKESALPSVARMRMTLEMTRESLEIVQRHQSQYRLESGHALPKWKIISEALVLYDRKKKGEGSEKK